MFAQLAFLPYRNSTRRKLADSREQRSGTRYIAVSEVVPNRLQIYFGRNTLAGKQRFDFRGEQQKTVVLVDE